ncbi:hypothetical protein [Oleiharenicola lentus]|uniref:hypothetical protein n=1 Tax=Oleiharenicola lentus TaxID=2508720 RepID=UPI003F66CF88
MKLRVTFLTLGAIFVFGSASAQPSFSGAVPATAVINDPAAQRAAYLQRVDEMKSWRIAEANRAGAAPMDMAAIAVKLSRGEDLAACSQRVIELMKDPGTGPFWMFPAVSVTFTGRDKLSSEARAALRDVWRTTRQQRGDTENHWVMYYASIYLMADLYPNEPAESWATGKTSAENLAEAEGFLLHWMELTTTLGQGEFNATHYIGEYAIPLLFLKSWAKDPKMRSRAHIMLDWIFADLAQNTLNGVLRGTNARTDDISVIERWNALASTFSWLLFGNTPPTQSYGGWGIYFAVAAENYELPDVIYRIAVDRKEDFLQEDMKRTRRRWRFSDVLMAPIYKTNYVRRDYAVGSYQGGLSDPIQAHVWDVTWRVDDPRGVHPTMFSLHPHSSSKAMQTTFNWYPEPMIKQVAFEGKPSYDEPDKILGCSPYEAVLQDRDTIIALYNIPAGERFPHINGFFSKDLTDVSEDSSGWIFARGGNTYLAYRPLASYTWMPYLFYKTMWASDRVDQGDRLLQSAHLKNGTIVQAASASEFVSMAAFKAAINALPLTYKLEPVPTVTFTSLRGRKLAFTYGETPSIDGKVIDHAKWKLFQGPYLNSDLNSRRLEISHGKLKRVLDLNTLTITDASTLSTK